MRLPNNLSAILSQKKYIFLALPLGAILLFIFFYITLLQPSPTEDAPTTPSSTQPTGASPEEIVTPVEEGHEHSGIEYEDFPGDNYYGDYDASGLEDVQKIEDLPDGTKKYTALSSDPFRHNIIITKADRTIYQRSIPLPEADIPIQNFIELLGQPEATIEGPDFYGDSTSEYLYATKGVSLVVNTSSGQVIEQHFFQPTTTDDYIKKYSNDSY